MRKIAVLCSLALMVSATSAFGGNLSPGEPPPGSIPWKAPWGNPANVVDHGDGTFTMDVAGDGSAGIFWRLPAWATESVSVTGSWSGDTGPGGWAEVLIFTSTVGMTDEDIGIFINNTGAGDPEIVTKHDSWDLPTQGIGPHTWGPNPIEDDATGWGPFEIHATCPEVIIATKVGNTAVATFDISYIPEPASVLLLGLPLLLVRRRR